MRLLTLGALLTLAGVVALAAPRDDKDQPATPSAEVEKLIKDFQKAQQDFYKAYQEAKTDEERNKLVEQMPKPGETAKRLLELAEKNAKEPDAAARALTWVISSGGYDDEANKRKEKALEMILKDHVASDKIADVCTALIYNPPSKAEEFLRAVVAKNPSKEIQGKASYALAMTVKNSGKDEESEKLFAEAAEKYGDVVVYGKTTVGDLANGELFEKRFLAVGKTVPEIEGEDLDAKKFKLSDYRGKVVLLDFWGNW
jgi:hypothetical protein